jgi:hypothetical protein
MALRASRPTRVESNGDAIVKDDFPVRIGDAVARAGRHEFSRRESHGDVT